MLCYALHQSRVLNILTYNIVVRRMCAIPIGQGMQYLQTRVTFHYTSNGTPCLPFWNLKKVTGTCVHVMNKISMSQTCLYSISYKINFFTTTSRYRGHPTIKRFHVTSTMKCFHVTSLQRKTKQKTAPMLVYNKIGASMVIFTKWVICL